MSRKRIIQTNDTSNKTVEQVSQTLMKDVLQNHVSELEDRCLALARKVEELNKIVEQKDSVIKHLEDMLNSNVFKIEVTDEEIIAEQQLFRLKDKAQNGELTLEEVKKFDLLVKNKRLAKGDATVIPDYKNLPKNISTEKLKQLASSRTSGDEDNDN